MKADFYDCCEYAEHLTHKTPEEAAIETLDIMNLEDWTPEITVYGWRRMTYTFDPERILADALEAADEEHSDPDGDGTEPTPAMIAAAEAFAAVLDREYVVWACECYHDLTVKVNVAAVVRSHAPQWLDEPAVLARVEEFERKEVTRG